MEYKMEGSEIKDVTELETLTDFQQKVLYWLLSQNIRFRNRFRQSIYFFKDETRAK